MNVLLTRRTRVLGSGHEHAVLASGPAPRLPRLLSRGLGELYRLRREFGRREYSFEIVPGPQVEVVSGGFNSVSHDPQIELIPTRGKYPYGLVLLRCVLESDVDEAALHFDVGSGYLPSGRVRVPRGVQQIVVALPPDVRGLRLCPRESPGPFRLSGVTITEISVPGLLGRRALDLTRSVAAEPRRLPMLLRSALRALRSNGLPSVARPRLVAPPAGEERTYPRWVRRYGTVTEADRHRAHVAIESWPFRPKISVLMPVFNAPEELLARAIESVRAQVYENWELCVADDASTDPSVAKVLSAYAAEDPRIRPRRRERNGHIAEATNSALADAGGEFVVFLDHDDELTPDALAMVVEALNRWPQTDLLYSDEDKLDEGGERFDPAFKPDWSPELLLAQNYVCHLLAIRTDLVRRVGGMRLGFEGSQDHDLVLRIAEIISAARIRHLPFVLYHWRRSVGSTATSAEAKPYAEAAGVRAVGEALHRRRLSAEVTPGRVPYSYRVRYALPEPVPRVSIIIPTRDRVGLLSSCITTLLEGTRYPDYEIIVVDNDSTDPETLQYLAELERLERARVLRYRKPFNFSAINNYAAAEATGSVLVLLNNDIEVISAGWLEEMASLAVQPDVGAVGALLMYPDGRIQHAGVVTGMGGVAGHAYKREPGTSWGRSRELTVRREVSAVTAACLAVERSKFARVGGLDAQHLAVAFNDVDLCLELRELGLRNLWTPHAILRHHESLSRGSDERPERLAAFQAEAAHMKKKWGHVLDHDPFFSPNYTFDYEIPQLAFPPRVTPFYREGAP
jgi:glycosyltransferase involved in cell wall biosynthesis